MIFSIKSNPMKKKSGHILIIVIFILFLVSFMWLLITKYVKNILLFSTEMHKYFKSYYEAYAGIELTLTQIKNHPFGFEQTIRYDSDTNKNNFKYCKLNKCYFELTLKSKSNYLIDSPKSMSINSCQEQDSYSINNWEWVIVPLFWDSNPESGEWTLEWTDVDYLTNGNFLGIRLESYNSDGKELSIWVSIIEQLQRNIIQKTISWPIVFWSESNIQSLDYDNNEKSFLILWNVDNSWQEQICVNTPVKLPSKYVVINSVWRYNDRFVSIEVNKLNTLPDYLIYNILN